jgi:hypothetical protein
MHSNSKFVCHSLVQALALAVVFLSLGANSAHAAGAYDLSSLGSAGTTGNSSYLTGQAPGFAGMSGNQTALTGQQLTGPMGTLGLPPTWTGRMSGVYGITVGSMPAQLFNGWQGPGPGPDWPIYGSDPPVSGYYGALPPYLLPDGGDSGAPGAPSYPGGDNSGGAAAAAVPGGDNAGGAGAAAVPGGGNSGGAGAVAYPGGGNSGSSSVSLDSQGGTSGGSGALNPSSGSGGSGGFDLPMGAGG